MEGERARDRKRRENSITACAAHFDDLIKVYPKGVPVAKDRKVQFVWQPPTVKRKWNSSQKRWLLVK